MGEMHSVCGTNSNKQRLVRLVIYKYGRKTFFKSRGALGFYM